MRSGSQQRSTSRSPQESSSRGSRGWPEEPKGRVHFRDPGQHPGDRAPVPAPIRRPRPRLPVLAVSLLALLAAGCGMQTAQAAHDPTSSRTVKLRVDGRQRSYLLEPALGLRKGKKAALVAVLHQEGGTPQGVAKETALQELRRSGAPLVSPAGVDHSWDAGKCCGVPSRQGVDDVRFLDAVFADA